MTVSSQTSTATFVGNGVATAFPLPFRFFDNGDIRAYFIDSVTGAATQMVLGTDYTLIGSGEPEVDGNAISLLTTTAPLANLRGLYVERVMQQVQGTDIVNQGQFFASTHEDVFDRLTMLIQQANANSQGVIRVAIGDPEPNRLPPALQRAGKIMTFSSSGDPVATVPLASDAAGLAVLLADDFNPGNGAALVGYRGRTVREKLDETATPMDYGAAGDGVSDDTAALAAAFSSGKTVRLGQDGVTYKVTGTLTVPAGAKITNDGAVINFTQVGVSALNIAGSDIEIDGVKLVGPNATDTYAANSSGITGTGLVSAYLINVVIKNCDIRNFGQSGIFLNYLAAGVIENNTIENVGYSGVHILSGFDCKVHGNKIVRCYPGSGAGVVGSSAAYGISITRNASLSAAAAPPSKNILVTNNIVRNVTTWEGLDTHGGDAVTFSDNIVENCWVAANVIHADGGGSIVPALKTVVSNNTFIAGNEPGAAVYVKPSSGTVVGDGGSVSVVDNAIFRYGTFSTVLSSQGAIYAEQATSGLIIKGNQFYECKYNGIRIYDYCYGVVISDNVFKDMLTISSVNRAIALDTANNSTVISGNAFIRTSGSFDAIYIGFTTAKVVVSADNLYFGTITKFPGVIPSDGTQRRAFVAKANINGSTGAVRSAIGLTSARTGPGAYTITLDEAMKTVNYVPFASSNQPITMVTAIISTTQFTIVTQSSVGLPADAGLLLVGVGME